MAAHGTVSLVQLSDLHVFGDDQAELLGVNTRDSLKAVIELLKREMGRTDLIILSGDLSQDFSEKSYQFVADCLRPLNIPTVCLPGNHDNVEVMMKVYPQDFISMNRHTLMGSWQIILLNSQKPGEVPGYLSAAELNFLEHCLKNHPSYHALVVFHHQPVPVGSVWLDHLNLKNADEFWQLVSHYPQLKAVFFGHVHQEYHQPMKGILCCSPPSTCIQFKPGQEKFALDHVPPGFRIAKLHPDGRIDTKIVRIPFYVGRFEDGAKGY